MQLIMDFFHKGGGDSEAIQKFWGNFCAPTILEFGVEKAGVDQTLPPQGPCKLNMVSPTSDMWRPSASLPAGPAEQLQF